MAWVLRTWLCAEEQSKCCDGWRSDESLDAKNLRNGVCVHRTTYLAHLGVSFCKDDAKGHPQREFVLAWCPGSVEVRFEKRLQGWRSVELFHQKSGETSHCKNVEHHADSNPRLVMMNEAWFWVWDRHESNLRHLSETESLMKELVDGCPKMKK